MGVNNIAFNFISDNFWEIYLFLAEEIVFFRGENTKMWIYFQILAIFAEIENISAC